MPEEPDSIIDFVECFIDVDVEDGMVSPEMTGAALREIQARLDIDAEEAAEEAGIPVERYLKLVNNPGEAAPLTKEELASILDWVNEWDMRI